MMSRLKVYSIFCGTSRLSKNNFISYKHTCLFSFLMEYLRMSLSETQSIDILILLGVGDKTEHKSENILTVTIPDLR